MIHRICDVCEKDWYSANCKPWLCEECGQVLDEANDAPLKGQEDKDVK
jgi:hypothetical protein